VECTLDDKFQMLALVEHSSWDKDRISKNYRSNDKPASGNLSPDTREFVILVLDGTAFPVRSRADVDLVKVIPVGPAFSCDLGGSRFSKIRHDTKVSVILTDRVPLLPTLHTSMSD
jgi:hypothetical protein